MASPMPCDSLGRIVYEGDELDGLCIMEGIRGSKLRLNTFCGHLTTDAGSVTVDLAASPPRTNYERYFADLGTRAEVDAAREAECGDLRHESCWPCPFRQWGSAFSMPCWSCLAFDGWLDERAVI